MKTENNSIEYKYGNMKIKVITGSFTQTGNNNPEIEKIVCNYGERNAQSGEYKGGTIMIYYYDKPPKELQIQCNVFHSQYGLPVSQDGSKIFVGDWDKGLQAYDTATGERLWLYRPARIRNIVVYSKYLVATRANASAIKIDIETGELLGEIKTGMLEGIYDVEFPYIYAETHGERCAGMLIDIEKMVVIKKYDKKIVTISGHSHYVIEDITLQENKLTISGFAFNDQDEKLMISGVIDYAVVQ